MSRTNTLYKRWCVEYACIKDGVLSVEEIVFCKACVLYGALKRVSPVNTLAHTAGCGANCPPHSTYKDIGYWHNGFRD